jgi:hypothetical protein
VSDRQPRQVRRPQLIRLGLGPHAAALSNCSTGTYISVMSSLTGGPDGACQRELARCKMKAQKETFDNMLDRLRTERDELRVRAHLARAEAADE